MRNKKTKKLPNPIADLIYTILGVILICFSIATILGLYENKNSKGIIVGGLVLGIICIGASIQNSRIRKRSKKKDASLNADELIEKYKS